MALNLFSNFPNETLRNETEIVEALLSEPGINIERIISTGQASPPDAWYSQAESEWVVVLRGSAGVKFENEADVRVLLPGDFINIPAHCRHRVEWTNADEPTVWLAVHYGGDMTGSDKEAPEEQNEVDSP